MKISFIFNVLLFAIVGGYLSTKGILAFSYDYNIIMATMLLCNILGAGIAVESRL
jgi:hypothetical protein